MLSLPPGSRHHVALAPVLGTDLVRAKARARARARVRARAGIRVSARVGVKLRVSILGTDHPCVLPDCLLCRLVRGRGRGKGWGWG